MSEQSLDQPTSIRHGEELDEKVLQAYLAEKLQLKQPISIKQFPSGFSNLTYLVSVGGQEFVLRKPPHGAKIKSAHDMGREFKVLSLLQPIYPYVPNPVIYEEDEAILGSSFYIMERLTGVILRDRPPKNIDLTPDLMRSVSENAIDHLASLHQLDVHSNGLIDLGKPVGYVSRQVEGWRNRYFKSETDSIKGMNEAIEWLEGNLPKESHTSFIHNDYKYDNLVLDPKDLTKIIAVLDWEMATVGDPLMDLGTTLGYWGEASDSDALKPFNLTWLPGNLTREEVGIRYCQNRGIDTSDLVFYYVFGAFKIGVIVQQIYSRYKKGLTKDPRFAHLLFVVQACAHNAKKAIEYNRISNFR